MREAKKDLLLIKALRALFAHGSLCVKMYFAFSYLCVFVFLRSRPVIHVVREVTLNPDYIDLEQHNCKGREGVW